MAEHIEQPFLKQCAAAAEYVDRIQVNPSLPLDIYRAARVLADFYRANSAATVVRADGGEPPPVHPLALGYTYAAQFASGVDAVVHCVVDQLKPAPDQGAEA